MFYAFRRSSVDPWSGADPRLSGECQSGIEQEADSWGQGLGALDAVGKSKGKGAKGAPRKPFAAGRTSAWVMQAAYAPLRQVRGRQSEALGATSTMAIAIWAKISFQKEGERL